MGGTLHGGGAGLLNSLISFMGFLYTPRLVSLAPSSLAGHLPPQTLRPASQARGWTRSSHRPPGPRLWDSSGSGAAWPPHRALHLKEISWDHQKPATLIAGILFLVSSDGFLQVFQVISQDPCGRSLCHHCVPSAVSLPRGLWDDPK